MNLEQWRSVAEIFYGFTTPFLITAGGLWAYARFHQQRAGKPRLDVSVDFKRVPSADRRVVLVDIRAINRGNTKISLGDGKDRETQPFFCYSLIGATEVPQTLTTINCKEIAEWLAKSDVPTRANLPNGFEPFDVFQNHGWIEPNETINDVRIVHIPFDESVVLEMAIIVPYKKGKKAQCWPASAAFSLMDSSLSSSDNGAKFPLSQRS